MFKLELNSGPTRRFCEVGKLPTECLDAYGFLTDKGTAVTRGIDHILGLQVALVVAPPWYGKTHVAEGLFQVLTSAADGEPDQSPFGSYVSLTSFHRYGSGCEDKPPWWVDWQEDTSERACWIVDAIDEDWHDGRKAVFGILEKVESLCEDTRSRLCLLIFCRKNEQPPDVVTKLHEVYGSRATGSSLTTLQVAPPDAAEGVRIAGSARKFEAAIQLIHQNSLGTLGSYPAVLQVLGDLESDRDLDRKQVWREVLAGLLQGGKRERNVREQLPPLDERFEAAQRAGAVLTFSRLPELDTGARNSSFPSLDLLFSNDVARADHLLTAARSLRHTSVLDRTATGYRFREQHVREWFSAFALVDIPLDRIRPLLSKDAGPFPHLRGVMRILQQTSDDESVRNWIANMSDELPLAADTLPLTLEDVTGLLDRLQQLTHDSPYALPIWARSGFENLSVPGVGEDLARRLDVPGINARERAFLLEVIEGVGASELVPMVQRIIQDPDEDDQVRSTASYTLHGIGDRESFAALAEFASETRADTRQERATLSNIIRGLLRHGVWGFQEAYPRAPEGDLAIGDASSSLEYELRELMTLEDARWLLSGFDWEQVSDRRVRRDPALGIHRRHHGPASFAIHAADLLMQQERPTREDYDLLNRVVLAQDAGALFHQLAEKAASMIAANEDARRALFCAGLDQDASGTRNWGWRWRWVLTTDDADWLADLAEDKGATSQWLWTHLLGLIQAPGLDGRIQDRMRERVRTHSPTILKDFDEQREAALEEQKRLERECADLLQAQEQPQFQIADIVQQILGSEALTRQQALHNLSLVCFMEDRFRPNNVIGRFEDLAPEVRRQVIDRCAEALQVTEPTSIPDGNSYPPQVAYEARAFATVLRERSTDPRTGAQVRKWLPAVLRFSDSDSTGVLGQCIEADQSATEDVLVDTIRREIRSDGNGPHTPYNLPVEYWSARLVERIAAIVREDQLRVSGRCNLLRLLAQRSGKTAESIAREWLGAATGDDENDRAMRLSGIDVLLYTDPEAGTQALSEAVDRSGVDVLSKMSALVWRAGHENADLKSWSPSALERLSVALHQSFPPDSDGPLQLGVARAVGPTDDLRRVRDAIHPILFDRAGDDDLTALSQLAKQFKNVDHWYTWARANKDAKKTLDILEAPSRPEDAVPWQAVVRLLDDPYYRLIRDSADLQRVLVEELSEIGKTVKEHLAMLYYGPKKNRKHQHESALSAYVQARLSDRLPSRVLDPRTKVVFLNREPLGASNRRFDLKVEAPTLEAEPAVVLIEVKWSVHREVSTSLRDQLGTAYLVGNRLKHGIYLVGWVKPGRWSHAAGVKGPSDRDSPAAWEEALKRQAAAFTSEHPTVTIEPLVMDLRWELQPPPRSTSPG